MAVCICHLGLGRLRQKGQPRHYREALSQKTKEANETKMDSHKHKFYLQGKKRLTPREMKLQGSQLIQCFYFDFFFRLQEA